MNDVAVRRSFEVAVPLDTAWDRLGDVRRWPEWAPHITSVEVTPDGPLGPSSSGALHIKRMGRNTFRMTAWEPTRRWQWTGGLPGVRIEYDHQFSPGNGTTEMTWVVALRGPLAWLIRPIFKRVYGRNVDRAIPRLQDWIRS